jgi:phage terminase large subunit-like protein
VRTTRLRHLCLADLYFLLRYGCGRKDVEHPWLFARCREVQADPDGYLDLWARDHYKSSIITFGLTIQNILNDPEITVGIFSHTRPIAKAFLRQIKREFEANERLKAWFPDILWENPSKEAPTWSEDSGIVVKRQGNPKESTVEAWGLVDGQPTSRHYRLRVYDDVVTKDSVSTPEMIQKTTESWELSDNLATAGGTFRVAGTRYHFNDSYGELMRRKVVKTRVYPATHDGTDRGEPVLLRQDKLDEKRRVQGSSTFATQMLLDPRGDESQGFQRDWLRYTKGRARRDGLNVYIVVDPASKKTKTSDYTSMWVIGLGRDENYTVLDLIRDRLNLTQRASMLFDLHDKWRPLGVAYEEYGLQADIQHIESEQDTRNYRFKITPVGGRQSKRDRIARLMPLFEQGRFYFPQTRFYTDHSGQTLNLIEVFIEEEYVAFPVSRHDDMLDALARIVDPEFKTKWPLSDEARAVAAASLPKMTNEDRRYDRRMGPPGSGYPRGRGHRQETSSGWRGQWGSDDQA